MERLHVSGVVVAVREFPQEGDCSAQRSDAQQDQPTADDSKQQAAHSPTIYGGRVVNLDWSAESETTGTMDGAHDEGYYRRSCFHRYLHSDQAKPYGSCPGGDGNMEWLEKEEMVQGSSKCD